MAGAFGLVLVLLALPEFGSATTLRAHLRRPRHGLQVRLSPITIAPDSEREVCLLETRSYSEPTVDEYNPPLRLEVGDGFHWTCNYLNATSATLRFGVTSDDEMCFTVGFFYPDDDAAPLPAVAGCFGGGGGLVCPSNH